MSVTTTDTSISEQVILGSANYGKSAVRLVKVTRYADHHELRDINVDIALEGNFEACHVNGDNSDMIATDTMRNTVYALAKEDSLEQIEAFGLALVKHFVATGPTVKRARVHLIEYPWRRIEVNGQAHPHSFVRDAGQRTATVVGTEDDASIEAGIDDLLILKTTNSGWADIHHDRYTTLPDTHDRIFATVLAATWSYDSSMDIDFGAVWHSVRQCILETFTDHYSPSVQNTLYRMGKAVLEAYPEVIKIHFSPPNKHHLLYDLDRFGIENNNEIFQVTTDPYGLIEGTIERRS